MKKLPLWRRPFGAKKILEIGGGHDPFRGVTHAVDKFPGNNEQRGGDFRLPSGAKFFQGDLEHLPFTPEERFDFLYASHVFEHVSHPEKAVSEINRLADRGYIETPSPLREQLACPIPFDAEKDFHTLFCWSTPGTLHVIKKSARVIGEFPETKAGRMAKALYHLHREGGVDLEPLLPRNVKTTKIFFRGKIQLKLHEGFIAAARAGHCAYEGSIGQLQRDLSLPFCLRSRRLRRLKKILTERSIL